ncbi:glycoside hydrolase family 3 protein [Hyaloscypha variabilis F]|uniref:xylan 1,4-beta-xylosidase n=1 Tax=Hyaloscypha variabilis (strain UAMH 11265 / GT02V1 / F) TaxID=1149755 RepID=A0A2J6RU96_HYAVF|nr:glycoside hydrolase family 3 protein [Hyaloscypha variabilis F]
MRARGSLLERKKITESPTDIYRISISKVFNPVTNPSVHAARGLPDCSRQPLCSNPICDASLSDENRVAGLLRSMTLEEKVLNMQHNAFGSKRLGLPAYQWWNEALHGVANGFMYHFNTPLGTPFSYATSFPMPILTSAAFNDELVHSIATIVGREGRAFANYGQAGLDFWTPNINPFRDPRWGRGAETPGEDPYRLQRYTYNLITGLQGGVDPDTPLVIATCKHFAAYDIETNRDSIDVEPTAQDLAAFYLPSFKTCTRDAKVGAVMCSYNAVNGIPACASRYLLQNVLREHWGWSKSYQWVTSDCGALTDIDTAHNYASSLPDAAAVAMNAGTDLACEFYANNETLGIAVTQNTITEATVDKSFSRLYTSLVRAGRFDSSPAFSSLGWADVGTAGAQQLAYEAAVQGMTLLKNDGTLPLPNSVSNVAVIGPWANATQQMLGNYNGIPAFIVSPLVAFQEGWSKVTYALGTPIRSYNSTGFDVALSVASSADYIVYCGGIDTSVEVEGLDRTNITWPENQLDLISQLAALKKPLVVVQFGGGQLDDASLLSNPGVGAIVWAGYPGQSGGDAVRDILDGTRSVAGRLPITQYPGNYTNNFSMLDMALRPNASTSNTGRTYMWYPTPVLPFGYGLHYTNFSVSWKFKAKERYGIDQILSDCGGVDEFGLIETATFATVAVSVKNTGRLSSDFVGLLFISTKNAGPAPYPLKALASYSRLFDIPAGETKILSLPLEVGSLARVDLDGNFVIYPGDYLLTFDFDVALSFNFTLNGEATTIEKSPVIDASPVAISYLGCFADSKTAPLLGGTVLSLKDTNTPQVCANRCHSVGFNISGVEGGWQCYCAPSLAIIDTFSDDSRCNSPCPGNGLETCGGTGFINVYNATPAVFTQPPISSHSPSRAKITV